jgi:hypothetical protein
MTMAIKKSFGGDDLFDFLISRQINSLPSGGARARRQSIPPFSFSAFAARGVPENEIPKNNGDEHVLL